jgi:hypothetical protein
MIDIINTITDAWSNHLQRTKQKKGGEPFRPKHVWASARRECVRQMSLDMMHPEDRDPWSVETMERFQTGDEIEHATNARLMEIGPFAEKRFAIEGQQERFEIKDRDGTVLIVGKIDGCIRFAHHAETVRAYRNVVYDVKNTVMTIRDAEDVDRNRFTKHWPDQILSYALARGIEYAMLIVRRPGEFPVFILYRLEDHLERAESFLRDARSAIDGAWGDAALPAYTENLALCKRCPHFGKSCVPPKISLGEGMNLIADPEFEKDLVEMLELEEGGRRYDKLKKINRGRVFEIVGKDNKTLMIGDVVAKTKLIVRRANPNPKPTPESSFIKVTYEKVAGENED